MTYPEILTMVKAAEQDEKKLFRIYMYAGTSDLGDTELAGLRQEICRTLQIGEEQFAALLQNTFNVWTERINRVQTSLSEIDWVNDFIQQNKERFAGTSLSAAKAKNLLVHFLSMALQRVSILTYKNHLKSKDIRILADLLTSEKYLEETGKAFLCPIKDVLKGKYSPTSQEFIQRTLAYAQCLAYYYLYFILDGKGARTALCETLTGRIQHMSLEEIKSFLYPALPADTLQPPAKIRNTQADSSQPDTQQTA